MEQAELKKHFTYDSKTGAFTRISRRNSGGSLDKDGYLILKIKGRQYKAHRMAWLYVYGTFPKFNIDHINGNRTDNRIENLRDVPQAVNNRNSHRAPNKDTGVRGVYLDKCTKGLLSRYTFRKNNRTFRVRTLQEAIIAKAS